MIHAQTNDVLSELSTHVKLWNYLQSGVRLSHSDADEGTHRMTQVARVFGISSCGARAMERLDPAQVGIGLLSH